MLSLGVAECRNVLAVQNGATIVDERRVARGSSGGGELGMLCGRVRGQERRAGEAHTDNEDRPLHGERPAQPGFLAPPPLFLAHLLIKVPRGTGAKPPDFPARPKQ